MEDASAGKRNASAARSVLPLVLGLVVLVVLLNLAFSRVNPSLLVDAVGVQNTYAVVFAIAAVGGLSSATGPVLLTTLAAFAAGGAHPFLLGIAAGVGLFISDSLFYLAFSFGRRAVPERRQERIRAFQAWVAGQPYWRIALATYAYLALTPLPNDVVTAALGLSGYPYRAMAPVLLAAALTLALVTAHVGAFAWGGLAS